MFAFDEIIYDKLINIECSDYLMEQIKQITFDDSIFNLNKRNDDINEHTLDSDMDESEIFKIYGVSKDSSDKLHEKCIEFAKNETDEQQLIIAKIIRILSDELILVYEFITCDRYYMKHEHELNQLSNKNIFWIWLYSKCCSVFLNENISSQ